MKVYLIGVGLGNPDTLTVAAQSAISACPVLVGAPRLLEPYGDKTCAPYIAATDICEFVARQTDGPVGVLLSGDVGFYSGAKNLWPLLKDYETQTIPGISSLAYFCAKLQTPWQDAKLVSAHGRAHNAAGEIQRNRKTFALTGGQTKAEDVCRELAARGLGHIQVSVGEKLSYPDERIVTGTAQELAAQSFDDLCVLLAVNEQPIDRVLAAPGIPDGEFLRGEAPMTKEEVRAVSISKLRLKAHHVLWDVGAGTGSVSVEGALAVPAGRVFAVEKKPEALALLEENKWRFGVCNLTPVAGTAPEALLDLPAPDRVFLGGTSGNLEEILNLVFTKNPAARVVVNAVTLETLAETVRVFECLKLGDIDIAQVSVTKTRDVGRYHMLSAQNPVWVLSGEGTP